jgi:hypothetical protein
MTDFSGSFIKQLVVVALVAAVVAALKLLPLLHRVLLLLHASFHHFCIRSAYDLLLLLHTLLLMLHTSCGWQKLNTKCLPGDVQ